MATAQDTETVAFSSLLQAAKQEDDPDIMFQVGLAYFSGEWGAPKDVDAAKRWLRLAAARDHSRAQASLGRIVYDEMEHLRTLALVQDYQAMAEAHKWLARASEHGELDATETLIPLYVTKGDLAAAIRTTALWVRRKIWTY